MLEEELVTEVDAVEVSDGEGGVDGVVEGGLDLMRIGHAGVYQGGGE